MLSLDAKQSARRELKKSNEKKACRWKIAPFFATGPARHFVLVFHRGLVVIDVIIIGIRITKKKRLIQSEPPSTNRWMRCRCRKTFYSTSLLSLSSRSRRSISTAFSAGPSENSRVARSVGDQAATQRNNNNQPSASPARSVHPRSPLVPSSISDFSQSRPPIYIFPARSPPYPLQPRTDPV